ncbi:outer membrane protein [Microvirga rosea]|uniref:outer membrane protein n=1 Tax=Microvirga rosea TaxID=2715425 RepID=UPI001D0B9304|nr:outer membrane beta-barrel protein [Microvirga rosea]MCB8822332.1 outer membrane beta-barrel protein [Microvirga rosea]
MRQTFLALASLALSLAGSMAYGADLPPAPVLDDSDEPTASGWYLRGDIGLDEPVLRHGRDLGTAFTPALNKARFDREVSLGGGIGFQLAPFLRTDLTIDHRFGATYKGSRWGGASGLAFDRADFEATTVLLNAYIDLPLWDGVTPYLGAGIGVSRNRMDEAQRTIAGMAVPQDLPARTQTALAWALTGGVAVDLTANLKLDIGYRYSHLGWARTGFLENGEPPIRARSLGTHELRIGARYYFN